MYVRQRRRNLAQAAAIGVPDSLRGNVVKAFIVLAEDYEPSTELAEQIRDSVKTRLAASTDAD